MNTSRRQFLRGVGGATLALPCDACDRLRPLAIACPPWDLLRENMSGNRREKTENLTYLLFCSLFSPIFITIL